MTQYRNEEGYRSQTEGCALAAAVRREKKRRGETTGNQSRKSGCRRDRNIPVCPSGSKCRRQAFHVRI